MKLAIFDVDGTLTTSYAMDDACYMRAFEEEMGVRNINNNWLDYDYSTNSGIALQICEKHISRHPTPEEQSRLKNRYFSLIRESFQRNTQCVKEVPGAIRTMRALKDRPDWQVAIATGGWLESALLKLQRVRIPIFGVPIATADDVLTREDIIVSAIRQALEACHADAFSRIVYMGDGLWDLEASRQLGLAFVGRNSGEGEKRLRAGGASHVIPDYGDQDLFFQALETASVPRPVTVQNPK